VIFHVLTIFPDFFRAAFEQGVVGKARTAGLLEIRVHDLRDGRATGIGRWMTGLFGGGEGSCMKAGPIFEAVESIWPERISSVRGDRKKVVLLSAQGARFDQARAREFSTLDELFLICGPVRRRRRALAEHLADEELSIGDFVLSGGELGAAVVIDATARLLSGVLGNENSAVAESFGEEVCWIVRSIRGRPNLGAGRFPEFLRVETTKIFRKCGSGRGRKDGSQASGFNEIVGEQENAKRSDDEDPEQE